MFHISFVIGQVNGKCKQLNDSDIRMWEENEFEDIVHTVGISESVPDACIGGEEVQYIESSHSIGRVLSKEVDKFGDQRALLDHFPSLLVEGHIVINQKCEVQQEVILAGKKPLQFLYYLYLDLL